MLKRIILVFIITALSACASLKKDDQPVDPNQLPPTATGTDSAGTQVAATFDVWEKLNGKSIRTLTRNARYPNTPTTQVALSEIDFASESGDQYARRIIGLLNVDVSTSYTFRVSADHSSEIWLSTDASPENKRLIAFNNKPTGYLVWDAYNSQVSKPVSLESGKAYFFEVLHKEHTSMDYLRVEWASVGSEYTVISSANLSGYVPLANPDQPVVDEQAVYVAGYHVGYSSGMNLASYDATYPVPDQDNDGLPDFYEVLIGSDPNDLSDALADNDGDQLSNYDEYLLLSNPANADTDGDSIPDGFELAYGMSLLDSADASLDLDGDGISNVDEYLAGSEPNNSASVPAGPVERVVTLSWEIPTQREDGSDLLIDEIQEYRIYSGASQNQMDQIVSIDDPALQSYSETMVEGTYYFAISTVTKDGVEGPKSETIELVVN